MVDTGLGGVFRWVSLSRVHTFFIMYAKMSIWYGQINNISSSLDLFALLYDIKYKYILPTLYINFFVNGKLMFGVDTVTVASTWALALV